MDNRDIAYVDAEEVWKACQEDVSDLKNKISQAKTTIIT